jgi:hypothetical protein
MSQMEELPAKKMFSESLNSKFLIEREGNELIALKLIELRNGHSDSRSESFSLLFRGPGAFVLPQQIYKLRHDRLGVLDLFLVPVSRDANGVNYEVVFNRLLKS